LALYGGPLLPGFFVDETPEFDRWVETERARLQQRALHAVRQLSDTEERAGRLTLAIEWARRATSLAPHDEGALRRLMMLLEQSGDRAGATRAYDELAKTLEDDLELEPSAETTALYRSIRDRESQSAMAPTIQAPVATAPTITPSITPSITPAAVTVQSPVRFRIHARALQLTCERVQ
jgi:DNA-binding SARP family transcriptional activator